MKPSPLGLPGRLSLERHWPICRFKGRLHLGEQHDGDTRSWSLCRSNCWFNNVELTNHWIGYRYSSGELFSHSTLLSFNSSLTQNVICDCQSMHIDKLCKAIPFDTSWYNFSKFASNATRTPSLDIAIFSFGPKIWSTMIVSHGSLLVH